MLDITSQRQEIDMFGWGEDWPQDVHRMTGNNDIASVIFNIVGVMTLKRLADQVLIRDVRLER